MLIPPANPDQPWKRLKSFGFAAFTIDKVCIIGTTTCKVTNFYIEERGDMRIYWFKNEFQQQRSAGSASIWSVVLTFLWVLPEQYLNWSPFLSSFCARSKQVRSFAIIYFVMLWWRERTHTVSCYKVQGSGIDHALEWIGEVQLQWPKSTTAKKRSALFFSPTCGRIYDPLAQIWGCYCSSRAWKYIFTCPVIPLENGHPTTLL